MPHLISSTSVRLLSVNQERTGRCNHANIGQGNENVAQSDHEGTSTATPSCLSLTPVPLPSAPGFSKNDHKTTVFGLELAKVASYLQFKILSAEDGRNTTWMPSFSTSGSDRQSSHNQETRLRNNNRCSGTVFSSSVPRSAMVGATNDQRSSSSKHLPVENSFADH